MINSLHPAKSAIMEYIAQSIPGKGKLKNGDSHACYADADVLIALVADGVGGGACDWKASEQACHDLIAYYRNEYHALGLQAGVAQSLRAALARTYAETGECAGMLTTLVGVAIDKRARTYYYFGIGDSLVLRYEADAVEELTPETEFVITPEWLPDYVKAGGVLQADTAFALMTDGIHANRKSYQSEIALVLASDDWKGRLDEIMRLNQVTQFDDMTLLLIKKQSSTPQTAPQNQ